MAADASVAWHEMNSQPLIGQTIDVSLTFDNKGNIPGYGPYVDLVVPDKGLKHPEMAFVSLTDCKSY